VSKADEKETVERSIRSHLARREMRELLKELEDEGINTGEKTA
jgi:hypothetical protein